MTQVFSRWGSVDEKQRAPHAPIKTYISVLVYIRRPTNSARSEMKTLGQTKSTSSLSPTWHACSKPVARGRQKKPVGWLPPVGLIRRPRVGWTPRLLSLLPSWPRRKCLRRPEIGALKFYGNRNSHVRRDLLRRLVDFLPGRAIIVAFAASCQVVARGDSIVQLDSID